MTAPLHQLEERCAALIEQLEISGAEPIEVVDLLDCLAILGLTLVESEGVNEASDAYLGLIGRQADES